MKFILLFTFITLSYSSSSQKEDYQWLFNTSRIDSCFLSLYPDDCNASILDFNFSPPIFYRKSYATLDIDWTHASLCDQNGQLQLYSNGMSINGPEHIPIINGDTISYGPLWDNNTWLNENGEVQLLLD